MVALILLSFLQPGQFWAVFLTQGLLMGLTIAFGVQPALTVVGQHFKKRQALAMGLATTGSSLGGIGFPLMFERLVPIIGFSNALRMAALKIGSASKSPVVVAQLTNAAFAIPLLCSSQRVSTAVSTALGGRAAHSSTSEAFWIFVTAFSVSEPGLPFLGFGSRPTT